MWVILIKRIIRFYTHYCTTVTRSLLLGFFGLLTFKDLVVFDYKFYWYFIFEHHFFHTDFALIYLTKFKSENLIYNSNHVLQIISPCAVTDRNSCAGSWNNFFKSTYGHAAEIKDIPFENVQINKKIVSHTKRKWRTISEQKYTI